jgi:hypothetical protein
MTLDDLFTLITGTLGITREQLLYALGVLAALAPVVSWLRPRVEPTLTRWREAAARTKTPHDDRAVSIAAMVWRVVSYLPAKALTLIPIFASEEEVAEVVRKRREAKLLESRR